MEKFMAVIAYVGSNWEIFTAIIGGLLAIAVGVTKLTASTKDDEVVFKISTGVNKVLEFFKPKKKPE